MAQQGFLREPLRYPIVVFGLDKSILYLYNQDFAFIPDPLGYWMDNFMNVFCCFLNKGNFDSLTKHKMYAFS